MHTTTKTTPGLRESASEMWAQRVVGSEALRVQVVVANSYRVPVVSQTASRGPVEIVLVLEARHGLG